MVQMVSMISSTKRDNENREKQERANNKAASFAHVLNKTFEDKIDPDIVYITYDATSHINTYLYHKSKEYTF